MGTISFSFYARIALVRQIGCIVLPTISFQVGESAFDRLMFLSKQVDQPLDDLLHNAFDECMHDLEDLLEAKTVLESNEPVFTLPEVEKMLGLDGKI